MSQNVTLNGSIYTVPDVGDNTWGQNTTDYLVAIAGGTLQKTGGTFLLSAELDFGSAFGVKSLYYKTRTANIASAGQFRLAKTDTIAWRDNANGADLPLAINGSDQLTFNGIVLATAAATVNAAAQYDLAYYSGATAVDGSSTIKTNATGDLVITAANKVYLSATAWIVESASNVIDFNIGGVAHTLNGTGVFTGSFSFANGLTLSDDSNIASTKKFYLDGGGNTYLTETAADQILFVNGGTSSLYILSTSIGSYTPGTVDLGAVGSYWGDARIGATKKFYFDGAGANTYITEFQADEIRIYTGGSLGLLIDSAQNIVIGATKILYFDSGVDSYIYESSGNNIGIYTNGTVATNFGPAFVDIGSTRDFSVAATKKIYLDGGGNTYLYESAADEISIYAGAVNSFEIKAASVFVNNKNLVIPTTKGLYFDGGGDTFLAESAANEVTFTVGGVNSFEIKANSIFVNSKNLVIPSTKGLYLDGGSNTYLTESAADVISIYTNAAEKMRLNATWVAVFGGDFIVDATQKLRFDGSSVGDTYIYESSANNLNMFAAGASGINLNGTNSQVEFSFSPYWGQTQTTGAVTVNLTNAPTGTTATPYKWVTAYASDGQACWMPLWKK